MDEFTPCSICTRTPLVGEGVAIAGEEEVPICNLCLHRPRAAALGEPLRRERVHSVEGAETVARVWPTPVHGPAPAAIPG
jgi:hypothetical protein